MEEMASRCGLQLQIYQISNLRQLTMGDLPAKGLGEGLTTYHYKEPVCYEMLHRALNLDLLFGMT
jgi:hypothetical protein